MINKENNYDLIKFEDGEFSLDVKVSPNEDTVWLTQNDIALLFDTTKQNISLHTKNIFVDNELDNSVVKDFLTTAADGKNYKTKIYNLDMIIAIGYRVNSKRGTLFRKWANSILKQYLLKGHIMNEERCLSCTSNILELQSKYKEIEEKVKDLKETVYSENNKLFYEGEILEPYSFFRKLFFLAKANITITDYYADSFLISMLSDIKVDITIVTSTSSYLNNTNVPYNIRIIHNDNIHGRYIFIDEKGYVVDNSFNAIGKKRFVVIKLITLLKK